MSHSAASTLFVWFITTNSPAFIYIDEDQIDMVINVIIAPIKQCTNKQQKVHSFESFHYFLRFNSLRRLLKSYSTSPIRNLDESSL